ncbi:MAG: nucleotidyltransferase domain-containing protein [Candidatus Aenigmarchaeota archaeon]|nr:nucleotidyltransferase domain-containing protein [Candidatus Aenigmarchaeota archaeon]
MNIDSLLSTKERVKILRGILYRKEILGVNRIAKELDVSNGLVSLYFDILVRENILKRRYGKFILQDSIATKALKILLNLSVFDRDFFRKYKFIRSAGLYGSMVKGTNTNDSDIDLWVVISKTTDEKLAGLTSELQQTFGNVKPLYLTKEKLESLKKTEHTFYYSLLFSSIVIYGDGIETV